MPIDPRRRDDIVAAVAAHDSANPSAPLPRNTARLLAAMFPSDDVCQRSLEDIAAEGFDRSRLPAAAAALWSRLGSLSKASAARSLAQHLPAASAAGCSHEAHRREKVFGPGRAVPLDRNAKARIAAYARAWSARNRQPGQHTRARSPAPSWRCWRPCCGASTTAAPAAASRATRRSPPRPSAPAARSPRPST